MATQVTNYQCPNCMGPLRFDGQTGQLACDYCGADMDVSLAQQLYADQEQAASKAEPRWDTTTAGGAWSDEEAAHIRAYSCPSCAAELICDDTTAATSCPYCGNPTVVPGQFAGQLKPDYVIPFTLDKAAAVEALKKYYKGKKFLPKSFTSDNRLEEIKGIYVPFWLFDGRADVNMRFRGTLVHRRRCGDEEITVTEHYRITRSGHLAFEKVPADGSSKMPDAHMDAIEPFDYTGLKPFSTAYLPGFLADKYDVDADRCVPRANERIKKSAENAFSATISGYSAVSVEYADIRILQGDIKYALLPVWMLATKWKGQSFLFALNAQTGKLIGDLPVDSGRVLGWFAKISLPLMAVFWAILFAGGWL